MNAFISLSENYTRNVLRLYLLREKSWRVLILCCFDSQGLSSTSSANIEWASMQSWKNLEWLKKLFTFSMFVTVQPNMKRIFFFLKWTLFKVNVFVWK